MLGKQWLNRYLRRAGGAMIECCGDRQRKFDDLQKWPFRLLIESLLTLLCIALLVCGLSRYVWSIITSTTRVVISTILGFLFYIGIVVVGTYPPPTSQDSGVTQKLLASLFLPKVISLIDAAWRNIHQMVVPTGIYGRARRTERQTSP
ncbi:hypothetical protein BDM02DRAFT_3130486 [Thelephora ganbajun]|uniref:Uncharacterized protein n=1 Tax=Thelephora ganbajun TaxID=370292 RepID=A0ACB6ZAV8_THEGA|nr:hypothetical protein BDM02DRAFT_3130486 [Thelephora ganbajun]